MDDLVAEYLQARVDRDNAQAYLDAVQELLVKEMERDQRKTITWKERGYQRTLTYVIRHVPVIDEKGLRKALTAKVFDRYTKKVLDKKAMQDAMSTGEVDKVIVSKYVTDKPSKPFLTLHEKEAKDE